MVSTPCYTNVRVLRSVVKSDHRAVLVNDPESRMLLPKTKVVRKFRRRSPKQHAAFLHHLDAGNDLFELNDDRVQERFDAFYTLVLDLLDRFYPERSITISSRDPYYITLQIKHMLREKNKLMQRGNIEGAAALSGQVGKAIARCNATQFVNTNHAKDTSASGRLSPISKSSHILATTPAYQQKNSTVITQQFQLICSINRSTSNQALCRRMNNHSRNSRYSKS